MQLKKVCSNIEYLQAQKVVNNVEIETITPRIRLETMIIQSLASQMSDYILENYKDLPLDYLITDNFIDDAKEFKIGFYMISIEELERLKEIEWKYNQLCK